MSYGSFLQQRSGKPGNGNFGMPDINTEFDDMRIRCPVLGHPVSFKYCRTTVRDRICRRIKGCWSGIFDVSAFLEKNYSPEELQVFEEVPEDRISLITRIVNEVKARKEKENPDE